MARSTPSEKASEAKQPEIGAVAPPDEHVAPTCTVGFCPICLAVTAVQPMRPEVLEHLLNAGREFLLAAKSVLDARADTVAPEQRPTRLEKIDIG